MQKLLYFVLLISITACGQSPNNNISTDINNSKTSHHINIPGTRLYIIPPPNFKVGSTFIGLQNNNNAIMNVYDLVGGNFYTNAATFSKSAFEDRGLTVLNYEDVKVDGYPGKFVSLKTNQGTLSNDLVFGDTTFSTMIMTVCPANDTEVNKELINSLNTIWYNKGKKIDPLSTADFMLNDKVSKFRFFKYAANMYVYTIGGVDTKGEDNAPIILVTQIPYDGSSLKSIAADFMKQEQQYGLSNMITKNPSDKKINGYNTYQSEVYAKVKNGNCLLYYCVVSGENKVIILQGMAKNNFENNLAEFKKLANTIRLK